MSQMGTQPPGGTDLTTTNTTLLQLVQALNNLTTVIADGNAAGEVVGPEIVTQLTAIVTQLVAAVTALGELGTINTTLLAGNVDLAAINTALGTINTTLAAVFPARILTGSATFNPPSIANGASTTTTVTVTGSVLGNRALASFSLDTTGVALVAQVTSANTVTVIFLNLTGGSVDLASGTLAATVFG